MIASSVRRMQIGRRNLCAKLRYARRPMTQKLRAAVLGATGLAGQQFLAALAEHPFFEITRLCASERSAGKRYAAALGNGPSGWFASLAPPVKLQDLEVGDAAKLDAADVDIVFSALESDAAKVIEPRLAASVPVFSTASAYRYEPDVPILLPGCNGAHAALIDVQRRRRGWRGFIAPGPNCTATGLAICLQPIAQEFGLRGVIMTSLQSVSGAGRSAGSGVLGLDILDNVIPYIPNEEEKVEREICKILGTFRGGSDSEAGIEPLPVGVSCTCTRVAVQEGHTEAVFCATEKPVTPEAVRQAFARCGEELTALELPSMPARLIEVRDDPYRPQPRLDRDTGRGMTTVVGRLRPERVLGEHGVKFVLLSHNTRMGAAAGSILTAEFLLKTGVFGG
jgi:aspartate-semialdehyde dehydrogenase